MLRATRNMLNYFSMKKMKYKDVDSTKGGKDVVTVGYTCNNIDQIDLRIFVGSDESDIAIRVWTIAKVPANKTAAVQAIINELNDEYRWYRFYLDSDNEVTAAVDAVVTQDTIGPVSYELIKRGVSIIDDAYPKLMKTLWS